MKTNNNISIKVEWKSPKKLKLLKNCTDSLKSLGALPDFTHQAIMEAINKQEVFNASCG